MAWLTFRTGEQVNEQKRNKYFLLDRNIQIDRLSCVHYIYHQPQRAQLLMGSLRYSIPIAFLAVVFIVVVVEVQTIHNILYICAIWACFHKAQDLYKRKTNPIHLLPLFWRARKWAHTHIVQLDVLLFW